MMGARSRALVLLAGCAPLALAACGPAEEAGSTADASARLETRLRVRVEPVRRGTLASAGAVMGSVRAFHRAAVTAETQGRVVSRVVEPGASVAAGDVLVELEASRAELELARAEAALAAARTVLGHAEREFTRGEKLVASNAISTQRLDDLRHGLDRARDELALAKVSRDTARRNLADTKVRAPFGGTLDALTVDVGDFVAAGTPVATVVDLSRVRIFGGVTAREAARLSPGTPASVTFADLGGARFEATLRSVGRVADATDGTYEIELWLDDPGERMRDGLVARVELPNDAQDARLLTRRRALLRSNGTPQVFVIEREDGREVARTRSVHTGRSEGEWVEVLDGLDEGDRVVTEGQFALENGSVVQSEETRADVAAGASE